jgi:hypothetical protein
MGLKTSGTGLLAIHGRLSIKVVDPDGNQVDYREGDNIMCTNGVTVIANALVWSGIQDQATNLGVTTPTFLTPLWGAVGSGTTTPTAADTLLTAELARVTVGAGSSTPATPSIAAETIWTFYFPTPATSYTVGEAGVFANGTSNGGSVATAGTMLDHWVFTPTVTVTNPNTLILQAVFNFTGM